MKSIVLLFALSFSSSLFALDKNQCTIDLVRYLTFYNYKGFIPLTVGKIAKMALSSCHVPYGTQFTEESTQCAIERLGTLGQLGYPHSLCQDINTDIEEQCFQLVYQQFPEKRLRPVNYLKECIGVTEKKQLDCISAQLNGWRAYFFDEDEMKECKATCRD